MIEARAIATASSFPWENTGTSTCAPITSSCLIAAGRYISSATRRGRFPCFLSMSASFPAEVVLPEPCRPTSMMTVGGFELMLSRLSVPPMSAVSSSSTILTTVCAAVNVSSTSCPMARSFTRFTKSFTTLKLTSASRSAIRISRMASFTSSSVSLPCPRSFLKIPCRRSDRFSNSITSPPSFPYP